MTVSTYPRHNPAPQQTYREPHALPPPTWQELWEAMNRLKEMLSQRGQLVEARAHLTILMERYYRLWHEHESLEIQQEQQEEEEERSHGDE